MMILFVFFVYFRIYAYDYNLVALPASEKKKLGLTPDQKTHTHTRTPTKKKKTRDGSSEDAENSVNFFSLPERN
jgi:hypothetical protein